MAAAAPELDHVPPAPRKPSPGRALTLRLASGAVARAIHVDRKGQLPDAADALGLLPAPAALVVVGGAAGMTEEELARAEPLFRDGLAPLAERLRATVVDGGTDAGVMSLIGRARAENGASFPLVGVVAAELVSLHGGDPREGGAELEPNHTHFLLVPGSSWGDEAVWLARLPGVLAPTSVTVLVNGGDIAWSDAARSVAWQRPVVVVEGSGRTADALAAAARGGETDDRARELLDSGLLRLVELDDVAGAVATIEGALGRPTG